MLSSRTSVLFTVAILLLLPPSTASASVRLSQEISDLCKSILVAGGLRPSPFQLSPMDPDYIGERNGKARKSRKPVKYYGRSERRQLQITFADGAAKLLSGKKIYGCYLYVADRIGRIFILKGDWLHHHSSAIAGGPAACAGQVCFNDDQKISYLDRDSGHYSPSVKQFRRFTAWLGELGADLTSAVLHEDLVGAFDFF